MKTSPSLMALLVALFGAAPLAAQDSTSKTNLPPGDSLSAYVGAPTGANEQINDFVTDLAPFSSSWGNTYGIAPLLKGSQGEDPSLAIFYTHLLSAQGMSKDMLAGVPFPRTSYSQWSGPGLGVNDDATYQDPGTPVDTSTAVGGQFAVAFAEFGGPLAASKNNMIGGVVNFEEDCPSRLYVSRIVGAVNSGDYSCNVSQLGFGGLDADGNSAIRVDGFGSVDCGGFTAVTDNNIYRVDLLGRTAITNTIDDTGATDAAASDRLINNSPTVHTTPTVIPESVAGRPIAITTNFNGEYVYEAVAGSMSTATTHIAAGVSDTRGTVAYSPANFPTVLGATSVFGTAANIGIDGTSQAIYLNLWGLSSNGAPTGTLRLDIPAVITDNSDGWPSNFLGAGQLQFTNYQSQVVFRGGNGQVAVGKDQQGRMLVAATVDHPDDAPSTLGEDDHETQLISVARVTPGGATEWTVAAYCTDQDGVTGTGKEILDGPGGSCIGRLISLNDLTQGGTPGPSMSSPMIDSVGNLYFVGCVEIFGAGGTTNPGTGLVRAVYDPATFAYELELLFDTGDVNLGQNSTKNWQIRFLDINDNNSIGSSTAYTGNITAGAYNNLDPSTLSPSDSRTLGGMTINAQIIYDIDDDGAFDIQTGSGGVPGSVDEDYRVVLYLTSAADCNDNGVADDIDIKEGTSTDLNGNGIPDECDGTVGSNYCLSVPNSSGFPAIMSATGSASVSANDLNLIALPTPVFQNGVFFYGSAQLQQPFGNGFQCVGPGGTGIARLPIINGGPSGVMSFLLDNTMPPTPSTQITAGSTWNFQAWFRDPIAGGAFFNLSDGLEVLFTP